MGGGGGGVFFAKNAKFAILTICMCRLKSLEWAEEEEGLKCIQVPIHWSHVHTSQQ